MIPVVVLGVPCVLGGCAGANRHARATSAQSPGSSRRGAAPRAASRRNGLRLRLARERMLFREIVDNASDSVAHQDRVEVENQSQRTAGETQIREHLRQVHGRDDLDGLHFDDHDLLDDEIRTEAAVDPLAFVDDWKRGLLSESKPLCDKLVCKTGTVCGLEQARAEISVHFDRRSDDRIADGIFQWHTGRIAKGVPYRNAAQMGGLSWGDATSAHGDRGAGVREWRTLETAKDAKSAMPLAAADAPFAGLGRGPCPRRRMAAHRATVASSFAFFAFFAVVP
jgi:hypothetical protein